MNNPQHPLDDLFRKGLADLEISPAPAGRSDFLQKAEKALDKRSYRAWWFTGAGIAIILLFISGLLLFDNGTAVVQQEDQGQAKSHALAETNPVPSPGKVDVPSSGQSRNKPGQYTSPVHSYVKEERKVNTVSESKYNQPVSKTEDKFQSHEPVKTGDLTPGATPLTAGTKLPDSSVQSGQAKVATSEVPPIASPAVVDPEPEPDKITPVVDSFPVPKQKQKPPRSKDRNFYLGVNYTPEWIFNTLDSNKFVNNFGVEGAFHFGPYSIRTGVGLSITRGYNQVIVESLPYLGGYNSLDHIIYQWDENHYYLVPTIYTFWKEVFDTAIQYNYYFYEKQFTYLQIPLVIGYDFLVRRNWSIGVRAGPVMSVLLKSRVLTREYNPGRDRIININDITPDRIQVNWQAMGGINASWHFWDRFSVELEPDIRYYFNSVYEKKSISDKPWSVGFRAAILIKL